MALANQRLDNMTDNLDSLPLNELARVIAPGSQLARAWKLSGGMSADMTVLELTGPEGGARRVVLRRPPAAEAEFQILRAIHALGLTAPTPLALDVSGQILPAPYLVMEYIEGAPEFAPTERDSFARQLAAHLAAIHRAGLTAGKTGVDLSFLPALPSGFEAFCGLPPAQPDDALQLSRIRAALQPTWPFPRHNAPTLLHSDYWPGNVLWRAGRLAAVIDWEDAALGDPLIDLATSRLDLLWIIGPDVMEAFTRYYLSETGINATSLPYWDLAAALRLARLIGANLQEWAAFFHPFGRTDITAQTIQANFHAFVEQAFRS